MWQWLNYLEYITISNNRKKARKQTKRKQIKVPTGHGNNWTVLKTQKYEINRECGNDWIILKTSQQKTAKGYEKIIQVPAKCSTTKQARDLAIIELFRKKTATWNKQGI